MSHHHALDDDPLDQQEVRGRNVFCRHATAAQLCVRKCRVHGLGERQVLVLSANCPASSSAHCVLAICYIYVLTGGLGASMLTGTNCSKVCRNWCNQKCGVSAATWVLLPNARHVLHALPAAHKQRNERPDTAVHF